MKYYKIRFSDFTKLIVMVFHYSSFSISRQIIYNIELSNNVCLKG